MERGTKLWSELSSQEQETIREKWKKYPPSSSDIFCCGDHTFEHVIIPGDFYLTGNNKFEILEVEGNLYSDSVISAKFIKVKGRVVSRQGITADGIVVEGDFFTRGKDFLGEVEIKGNMVCRKELSAGNIIVKGDCTVYGYVNCLSLNVGGKLKKVGKLETPYVKAKA